MHVSNFFANPVATETAVLVDQLLGGGGQVFFCNSGAEANEAAIKLARKFGGRGRHTVVDRGRRTLRLRRREIWRSGLHDLQVIEIQNELATPTIYLTMSPSKQR